jgi:flavin reductase (DIM6/NTAB) family NADH-FMN oxidoreductase RutF
VYAVTLVLHDFQMCLRAVAFNRSPKRAGQGEGGGDGGAMVGAIRLAGTRGWGHVRRMHVAPSDFRSALGAFATGVCVVSARSQDGRPAAVTVNSFASVSLDPPLVLFCLDRRGSALAHFGEASSWAIHVLADSQQDLARRFARRRNEAVVADPWAGLAWTQDCDALPRFQGCLARLRCRAERVADGGDHAILIGRVVGLDWEPAGRPLLYFRGRFEAVAADEAA